MVRRMDTERRRILSKLSAFALAVGLVFAAAALAGSAIDPEVGDPSSHEEAASAGEHSVESSDVSQESEVVPGLSVSQDGYALVPGASKLKASRSARFSFRIVDSEGTPVKDFDTLHAREMHMIAVRRDLSGFQHIHPELASDGTWSARIDTSKPGAYRVFADFAVSGTPITLGTDLLVPGAAIVNDLPAPALTATAGDGYEATISQGDAGSATSFEITRNGEPVEELEPYLGADGHLVALREHDLAFLHTHPEGEPGGSGPISFEVDYPTAARYRLFVQFKADGEVRTAAFTVTSKGDVGEKAHDDEGEAHDGGH